MKRYIFSFAALLLLFNVSAFRSFEPSGYTKAQIETFIREVFADQADVLVLQSNSTRLHDIEDFLARVQVVHKPEYKGKKFALLSTVGLVNKYNQGLMRDAVCNPATFNPLKYHFPIASKSKKIYRFDNTDYLIIIQPIK